MNIYCLYFSPTGGTKNVMDILGQKLSVKQQIDLSVPDENYNHYKIQQNDLCLIGIPSYGGRVPDVALERLAQIQGNGATAILVVVYGNRAYDDTLLELKQFVVNLHFRPIAAVAAVAEHSIMHQFGTGRPDIADQKELQDFAEKIKLNYHQLKEKLVHVPGNIPYKEYHAVSLKPDTTEACTKCGLCAKKCPVQAISYQDPYIVDKEKCISCMRCTSICAHHAKKIDEALLEILTQKIGLACSSRKQNELFIVE